MDAVLELKKASQVMPRPYELSGAEVDANVDSMIEWTFDDLQSQFLTLPRGSGFIEFAEFQSAYEVLKRETSAFRVISRDRIWNALRADALSLVVLRTILGLSPPEWGELAAGETGVEVPQSVARNVDTAVRRDRARFAKVQIDGVMNVTQQRVDALVISAAAVLVRGAPDGTKDVVHRIAKFDTVAGLESLRNAADNHVPYAVLLYERYLGRPFASHRDSVSELVGDVMESAIEEQLSRARITFRKTRRAERIPGFEQAPDFFVPTEVAPRVIIEAKITNDDGTARDKVARILQLANMRDSRVRSGEPGFELVACIDGRGFGVRRDDMRKMLHATRGKVFTLRTLPDLIRHTDIRLFEPRPVEGTPGP